MAVRRPIRAEVQRRRPTKDFFQGEDAGFSRGRPADCRSRRTARGCAPIKSREPALKAFRSNLRRKPEGRLADRHRHRSAPGSPRPVPCHPVWRTHRSAHPRARRAVAAAGQKHRPRPCRDPKIRRRPATQSVRAIPIPKRSTPPPATAAPNYRFAGTRSGPKSYSSRRPGNSASHRSRSTKSRVRRSAI